MKKANELFKLLLKQNQNCMQHIGFVSALYRNVCSHTRFIGCMQHLPHAVCWLCVNFSAIQKFSTGRNEHAREFLRIVFSFSKSCSVVGCSKSKHLNQSSYVLRLFQFSYFLDLCYFCNFVRCNCGILAKLHPFEI